MNDSIMTSDLSGLTSDLCFFATGVVVPANEAFFARIRRELPLTLRRYPSGLSHNGWLVPKSWSVEKALIRKDGEIVFDGTAHTLGVAAYSESFCGELDWEDLRPRLVTNPDLPEAYVYHCMWQYRPWAAEWAFSVPWETLRTFGPGRYQVDLVTRKEPGEMLVGVYDHVGRSDRTIVFNAHTCHPHMANDDFAGCAALIRLFQGLRGRDTRYSYRLVLAPEHIGTIFYLNELSRSEIERMVGGVFAEMPATPHPLKLASSFTGTEAVDKVLRHAVKRADGECVFTPWRMGAGNDETVWEAPGYETPFVELSRCRDIFSPFREYHTNLDGPAALDEDAFLQFYRVLERAIDIFEGNARLYRKFNGLICLSNPDYDLYFERPDPAVSKNLAGDSEKWAMMLDSLFRYLDGSLTILDIAERHDLPFDALRRYLLRFEGKGLVRFEPETISRRPISEALG